MAEPAWGIEHMFDSLGDLAKIHPNGLAKG